MSDILLRDQVHDRLAEAIVRGDLRPGERLNEVHLAEELGVSRSPVREALRSLETEGLAVFTPRKGTVVAGIDETEALQFYDCRILVQCECVRLVTPALGEIELAALDAAFRDMSAAVTGDKPEYLRLVAEFHAILTRACPNAILADVIRRLERRAMRFRAFSHRTPERLQESLQAHAELLAALHAHDAPTAVELMGRMLGRSREAIVSALHADAATPV